MLAIEKATGRPNVLIYADLLLPPSATFIRWQAEALQDFTPYYVGTRRYQGKGVPIPTDRTVVMRSGGTTLGKLREVPLKVFGYAPIFFRRARRLSPVLVHAHTGPGAAIAMPLAAHLGIPLITSFHGGDVTADPEKKGAHDTYTFRRYWRRKAQLQSRGALFIAVSKFVQRRLQEQGYPEERTRVHYIGVDTEFFAVDPDIPRQPIVLFVGTLQEGKGCDHVIRAMARVQSVLPKAELVIIGNGPQRERMEQMARESLCRYRFLGTQPPESVRDWMNRAKVFSVGSITARSGWTEAFGLVYAEAQAMKLPVVSFASGGVPEAVSHEETGFLVPERDSEGLAHYLRRLLTDEATRTRMGEAGRRRVCSLFDLSTQTAKLEDLYRGALRGGTPLPVGSEMSLV
jgi:glycosyltransferase involved in cell wall biosynthesis